MNLTTVTRRAPALRDMERWVRAVIPRSSPPPSNVPRVLAALALLSVGAIAALMFAPMNGSEMRTATRKRVDGLRKQARDFAKQHPLRNGRGSSQSETQRVRRAEANS